MNKSEIGHLTVNQVAWALVNRGKRVFIPFGDSDRIDLIYLDDDGRVVRVQCKTARLVKGAIVFPTSSIHAPSRTGLPKTVWRSYRGEIDAFGVYCPATGTIYLVPVEDVPENGALLRFSPPKNGQKTHIRWAKQYENGAVAQLGAREAGSLEVTGSIPVGSTSIPPLNDTGQPSLPFGGDVPTPAARQPTRLPRKPR